MNDLPLSGFSASLARKILPDLDQANSSILRQTFTSVAVREHGSERYSKVKRFM